MSEERLIILRLLEQGRITEYEAEQLLEALGDMEYEEAAKNASTGFDSHRINLSKEDPGKDSGDNGDRDHKDNHGEKDMGSDRKSKPNQDLEDILKSIGKRIENLGEGLEDRIDSLGGHFGDKMINLGAVFADRSVDFAEKVVDLVQKAIDPDTIADTLNNLNLFGNIESFEEVIEKELDGLEGLSLSIEGYNGSIHLTQWDGDRIKFTAYISAKEGRYNAVKPIFELREDKGALFFTPRQVDWLGTRLRVQLPKHLFNFVKVKNKNAPILVEDLNCNKLLLQTKNNSIKLKGVNVNNDISCTTTNNKIDIENCRSESLLAASKNGRISIDNCKFKTVEGLTSNSRITVRDLDYGVLKSVSLKTSNAKIEIFGQAPHYTGLHFNANTTHGHININTPLVYVDNIKNYSNHRVNARTTNFDTAKNIVLLKMYTTNSSIYFYN